MVGEGRTFTGRQGADGPDELVPALCPAAQVIRPSQDLAPGLAESAIAATADDTLMQDNAAVTISGAVHIQQGTRDLRAERATIDESSNQLRADGGPAALSFGANRLPALLQQDGWTVDYPAWDDSRHPPLPTKVYASKPPYKVRLSIESWQFQ